MGNQTAAHGYSTHKTALKHRLSRIEGQVRGVARLVEEDTYCIDVLTQMSAIRSALDNVALELLRDHARHCMTSATDPSERDNKSDELVDAIRRML